MGADDFKGLGTIERKPEGAALESATLPDVRGDGRTVTLAEPRRNARRHVRLYHDADGRPFVRDRLHGRRYLKAIRFLTIDGVPLECGAAVLEAVAP